jgi:hypothetical protein
VTTKSAVGTRPTLADPRNRSTWEIRLIVVVSIARRGGWVTVTAMRMVRGNRVTLLRARDTVAAVDRRPARAESAEVAADLGDP